ncbi:MAG: TonB-dependent receptor [Bergeyella sp.]|nr:TonB-dependent receptor [Bergeyella sp.]
MLGSLFFISLFHYGQTSQKTYEYTVLGVCEKCKKRIEDAAKVSGADRAEWSPETKRVKLWLNPGKTSIDKILKHVAEVGHENERYPANQKAYDHLPECCKYKQSQSLDSKEDTKKEGKEQGSASDPGKEISGVTITKTKPTAVWDKKEAGLVLNIDKKELLKAACCNLSESFETNSTVDVSYSNAVTGAKQIKILGLDQKYTYITQELMPEIGGLSSAYGLGFIPGKWISGIQLTKGGGSVVNGYKSITGQINTELLKYKDKNETGINFYVDNNARLETNVTHVSALSKSWSQSILLHGNGTLKKMDYNKDGFMDRPVGKQANLAYILKYDDLEKSGWGSFFGINIMNDNRNSGQMGFDESRLPQDQKSYGVGIDIRKFQVWNKTGYIFKNKPYKSIGWMNKYSYYNQNSFYGLRNYRGDQSAFYSNLVYEDIMGNTNHKYKLGVSFLYDGYNEYYQAQNYKREERVPGIFYEYTLSGVEYTLVAGARADFHNLAGTQLSPRLNFKYTIFPKTTLRFSLGRGFRTANIFAENQQFFVSNRDLVINDSQGKIYGLKPEIAWNFGGSLQKEFNFLGRKSSVMFDAFRTNFKDQVLVDLDDSPQKMVFYNLEGRSFANSIQVEWELMPAKNLELRLAYKYYDVRATYEDGIREVPFVAKNRGFAHLSYMTSKNTKGKFWSFNSTLNLVGSQRVPNTYKNPTEFQMISYSAPYYTVNVQVSRTFSSRFRGYLGIENLTSTTQKNPIIDAKNPFGNYFDGGMVYAPIMPANFYLGIDINM